MMYPVHMNNRKLFHIFDTPLVIVIPGLGLSCSVNGTVLCGLEGEPRATKSPEQAQKRNDSHGKCFYETGQIIVFAGFASSHHNIVSTG